MSKTPFFSQVQLPSVKRSLFDKTFENKLSCNMGFLVPIMCEECVPGDKYRIRPEIFARMAPMVAPIMHRVDIFTHSFFVPTRLIWADFANYVSGGSSGTLEPVKPYFDFSNLVDSGLDFYKPSTLWDYLGLPTFTNLNTSSVQNEKICSLPFRAYQLIYNEFYRDKNLYGDNPWNVPVSSGRENHSNIPELLTLRRRSWQKDYFTSALPFAQRGPEVSIPLGDTAPVTYDGTKGRQRLMGANTNNPLTILANENVTVTSNGSNYQEMNAALIVPFDIDNSAKLSVDLSNATAITINALRRANAIQRFFERSAVGGSRLIESNFAHFGVKGKDATLQRPQYLGGSMQTFMISSVLQNAPTSDASVESGLLGSFAGNGISSSSNRPITHYCDEQGYIITIMSIMPRTSYQQGLPRMFSRFTRFDEYFPEFSHLGEQSVKQKELYFNPYDSDYNELDFGYQSRFSDMKYRSDEVHGDFRDSMDYWHMGRKFVDPNNIGSQDSKWEGSQPPVLNKDFVECHPTQRIYNVTLEEYDKVYCDCLIKCKALRPMPVFGTPSF